MTQDRRIDFIIMGAQKGGSTAAAYNLNLHPEISVYSGVTEYNQREIEFFNQHWDRDPGWYFNLVQSSKRLTGEKTAELLHRTICHARIQSVAPEVKLIILLRNPADRAYSQWRMAALNKKDESRSFHEAIMAEYGRLNDKNYVNDFYSLKNNEISNWREGYVLKGFYADQIKSLFQYFPVQNIHIAVSERVLRDKAVEYNRIFSFLKASPFYSGFEDRFVGHQAEPMDKSTRQILSEIYLKKNNDLFNLLGYEIPEWNII